jgi:aspartyl-tRNA synthetase
VARRPEGTENPGLSTGAVELRDCVVEVLSEAEAVPIPLGAEEVDEAQRLRYRFLDLRRERMQRNLRARAAATAALRRAMDRQGFVEVETPLLWTPTPEGAREFAVPSRLQRGRFYVLPQSPQIAKQLLMVGGVDRYYQIARCLRDEDLRADRQFEFTQLDVEASFVGRDDVLAFVGEAVCEAAEAVGGERPAEIPVLTWSECQDRFGSDKPDLRIAEELIDVTSVVAGSGVRALSGPCTKALRVPGGSEMSRAQLDRLGERARELGAAGLGWLRVGASADGHVELSGPLARAIPEGTMAKLAEVTGVGAGDLLLLVSGERLGAAGVLGQLRRDLCPPRPGAGHRFAWVVDFPLFEGLDEAGNPISAHHPFTMPHPDDLDLLERAPLDVRSQSYDLVLDGWELGSGSIRIHRADVQRRIFAALGISSEAAEERFGFLLEAFRYGAPPHGGFAVGVDRLVALLVGEEHIRELIAFPKTQSGTDLMTGAPKALSPRALAELGLRVSGP